MTSMVPDRSAGQLRLFILPALLSVASAVIKGNNDYQHYQQQLVQRFDRTRVHDNHPLTRPAPAYPQVHYPPYFPVTSGDCGHALPGDRLSKDFYRMDFKDGFPNPYPRLKPITECMFVTMEPGTFMYTSKTDSEEVCGIYFLAGPDQKVEINFLVFDVPCEHRGLISAVDGWELNGEVFPSETDHRLPLKQRISEFCDKSIGVKRSFVSSQNVAVVRYRIPKPGKGFTILARFLKNPRPCNVLAASLTEPYTLRNYGRRINCTYVALYPGTVQIIALGVGITNLLGSSRTAETGTLRKCDERNPHDQVVIGGSYGLDTSKTQMVDSICGIDSKPDYREVVGYGVTSVRLISSGFFENSVTVNIQPLKDEYLDTN